MKYKIVADSSANFFKLPGVDFSTVPLKIRTEHKEYVDTPQLDIHEMIEDLKKHKGQSSTSCPNVFEWMEALNGAENIFAVTITSNLSGSYSSAVQAGEEYMNEHEGANVFVVDSLSTGTEMQLIIEKLKEYIAEEFSFEKIREKIQEYQKHTHLLFSLQSLTNLARNGRVNPAVAKLAGVLGIRVVGKASDEGTLKPLHKCRGERKSLETIAEEMKKHGFMGGKVRISHCLNLDSAMQLKDIILKDFPSSDIGIENCSGLCSYYAEKGGLLVGYEGA